MQQPVTSASPQQKSLLARRSRQDTHGGISMADIPVGLFRLLYRLGVDVDCPIRLPAAKALGVEPLPGVISSIDLPCGPRLLLQDKGDEPFCAPHVLLIPLAQLRL